MLDIQHVQRYLCIVRDNDDTLFVKDNVMQTFHILILYHDTCQK